MASVTRQAALPPLPYQDWAPTRRTVHLWAQIVGKIRLALAPPRNHWWHATLFVDVWGLTTRRLHTDATTFDITFDFADHRLLVRTSRGAAEDFGLHDGLSVAEFDAKLHDLLGRLTVDVPILEKPYGVPMKVPFPEDRDHAAYDADAVHRFWRILDWVDDVFEEFAGWGVGKTSPPQLFWHSLDLAVTRFSGRSAPSVDGAGPVDAEAYSHEVISFGFYPGDDETPEPYFYSYTAPEPGGLAEHPLQPGAARWNTGPAGSMAMLPYDTVRTAPDPRATLLAFMESAYEAGAEAAHWPRRDLVSSWCPPPVRERLER
jgi:hypothetical protein